MMAAQQSSVFQALREAPYVVEEDEHIDTLILREQERAEAAGVSPVPFSSVEYFPPRTDQGVENLKERLARMATTDPLFVDFTWGAGGSTADLTLGLTLECKRRLGLRTNMHLTCTNMPVEKVDDALEACRAHGITNIVALRGDPPRGETEWKSSEGGFTCALDLVKYIREQHGSYFHVSVAGYPEGHPDKITAVDGGIEELTDAELERCSVTRDADGAEVVYVCRDDAYDAELRYLKAKVDAGANLILTQMFFDTDVFLRFVKACRAVGITVPIVPGVMCLNAFAGFKRMVSFCHTRVPPEVAEAVDAIGTDDEAMKAYGIEYGSEMCRRLLAGGAPGLHFYTLNLEKVVIGILKQLGMQGHYQEETRAENTAEMLNMIKSSKSLQSAGVATTAANSSSVAGKHAPLPHIATNTTPKLTSAPKTFNTPKASSGSSSGASNGNGHLNGGGATNGHRMGEMSLAANGGGSNGAGNGAAAEDDEYKVADLALADAGRAQIEAAQAEMPGLMALRGELAALQPLRGGRVGGCLTLTPQTAVLVETLAALGADVSWAASEPDTTEDAVAAALVAAGTAAVYAWRGQTPREHWACKLKVLGGARSGRSPDLLVDKGGDLALLLQRALQMEAAHVANRALNAAAAGAAGGSGDVAATITLVLEEAFAAPPREMDDRSRSNSTNLLDAATDGKPPPGRWEAVARRVAGLMEGTAGGRRRLQGMAEAKELHVPVMCCGSGSGSGCGGGGAVRAADASHQAAEAYQCATGAAVAGKAVVVCGYGARGKACAASLAGSGAVVAVAEADPVFALQAALDGFRVVELSEGLASADMCFNTIACKSVITAEHVALLKSGAVVASAGAASGEVDLNGLAQVADRATYKAQVDEYTFRDSKRRVLVVCEGKLPLGTAANVAAAAKEHAAASANSSSHNGASTGLSANGTGAAKAAPTEGEAPLPAMAFSASLTLLVLCAVELWKSHGLFVAADRGDGTSKPKYQAGTLFEMPKALSEKAAKLHLPALGASLTKLPFPSDADPAKALAYRY